MDQLSLVNTKNQLWRDLSWAMRKAYGGVGTEEPFKAHGYAQVTPAPFGFENKLELWNEIKAIIDQMPAAQADIEQANEDRIGASRSALD